MWGAWPGEAAKLWAGYGAHGRGHLAAPPSDSLTVVRSGEGLARSGAPEVRARPATPLAGVGSLYTGLVGTWIQKSFCFRL
jgi:hypothetical protein